MPAHFENLPDIDAIFSLDCFKFNDIKKVLNIILANLGSLNDKFINLENKFDKIEIPDVSKLMLRLNEMDKKVFECDKGRRELSDEFTAFKMITNNNFEEINENYPARDNELEEMIKNMQE